MKSLFLTNEYPPNVYGGAGVHVEYLVRSLAKIMEVEVRCFGDQRSADSNPVVSGFEVAPKFLDPADPKLKSALGTIYRCLGFNTKPVEADVVHCHTWYSHLGGILSKLLYGTPLVITTHSLEPLRPWKEEQMGRGYLFSTWVEKTALQMADAIIAVSTQTKQDIVDHFDSVEKKIHVIPNGIDTDEYNRTDNKDALERHGIPTDLEYVLFVGRITRQKGIIHLLEAVKHIDPAYGIVLCAGAPDTREIALEMEQKVEEARKANPKLFWIHEMLKKQDVIQFYSHASVFCCPSIYEPFGIINLEAMATETPVVASEVGGIKEVVEHGKTGFLVPLEQSKNPPFEALNPDRFARDLAGSLNTLLGDRALRRKMGAAGRARALEYSWDLIAKKTLGLYTRICERGK
jgi:alpha-maltose-1-phosphate synthase